MDEDKVFENEMELLELSFRSAKPQKSSNDWDRWSSDIDDSEWYIEYMRKRRLEKLKEEDDLNERR